ncbi:hypothetical protein SEVIR_1G061601v4 [Setaria viridis]
MGLTIPSDIRVVVRAEACTLHARMHAPVQSVGVGTGGVGARSPRDPAPPAAPTSDDARALAAVVLRPPAPRRAAWLATLPSSHVRAGAASDVNTEHDSLLLQSPEGCERTARC